MTRNSELYSLLQHGFSVVQVLTHDLGGGLVVHHEHQGGERDVEHVCTDHRHPRREHGLFGIVEWGLRECCATKER